MLSSVALRMAACGGVRRAASLLLRPSQRILPSSSHQRLALVLSVRRSVSTSLARWSTSRSEKEGPASSVLNTEKPAESHKNDGHEEHSEPASEADRGFVPPMGTEHFVNTADRIVLVLSLRYPPGKVPSRVGHGTINNAWGRVKVTLACLTMVVIFAYAEHAIRLGRIARDSGEESLYNDPSAQEQNARRRERWQMMQEEKASEERQAK